jgi:hypothetical protein
MADGDGGPCTDKDGGDSTKAVGEDMKASGVTTGEKVMTGEKLTASRDMKTLSSSEGVDVTVSTTIQAGWSEGDGACEDVDGACEDVKDLREPHGDGT